MDLTYVPLGPRKERLAEIDKKLASISQRLQRAVLDINIRPVPNKLLCTLGRSTVKIEVNGIKRGIIGPTIEIPLCTTYRQSLECSARRESYQWNNCTEEKLRQPSAVSTRANLFDCNYMEPDKIDNLKRGFMFALLGSDKPFIESLSPHSINQQQALENQFRGMTDIPFTYEDYESAREQLMVFVNTMLSEEDKAFLVSFEEGAP